MYNTEFIERNFRTSDLQKGIVNIGESNKDAADRVKVVQKRIDQLDEELIVKKGANNTSEIRMNKRRNEYEEYIFEHKRAIDKECAWMWSDIGAYQRKASFVSMIESYIKKLGNENDISRLKIVDAAASVREIKAGDVSRKDRVPIFDFSHSLDFRILSEVVIDTSSSNMKELIDKLKIENWFADGLKHFHSSEGVCPFCQQSIDSALSDEILNVFDKHRDELKEKIDGLERSVNEYRNRINEFFNRYASDVPDGMYESYDSFRADMISEVDALLVCVENKQLDLNVTIQCDTGTIDDLILRHKANVDIVNEEIDIWNDSLKTPAESISAIIEQMMLTIAELCRERYEDYSRESLIDAQDIEGIKFEIKSIDKEIDELSSELSELQKVDENVSITASNINDRLEFLGFDGFKILPEGNNYRIVRSATDEAVFNTLSEGEKTLITFLYFVDLCTSKRKGETPKRIVVLDDPITSMSMSLLYEVSATIIYQILKNELVTQTFIMTHNIFFLNEFIIAGRGRSSGGYNKKKFEGNYALFEVRKSGGNSMVKVASVDDFANDYESYWKVFSDLKNSSSNVLIANAMRNIIEYFSSVVCGDRELSSVKGKLIGDDMKLSPLFRYIDRGSHSDSYNVSMFSALDFPDYQRALKLFFSEIGYEDHYNVMSARYF